MHIILGIGLILAIISIISGMVIFLVKKMWKPLIITGCVCLAVVILFVAFQGLFYYNREEIIIHTSSKGEEFSIDLKNRQTNYEYYYTDFVAPMNLKQIKDNVQKQYPDAMVEVDREKIKITKNNAAISIKIIEQSDVFFNENKRYCMEAEFISLYLSEETYVDIPFPKEYLDIEGAYEDVMPITCDFDKLKSFYKYFNNVEIKDKEIIIKQEKIIHIKVEDGKVHIQVE